MSYAEISKGRYGREEDVIVQYGYDLSSPVDMLGYSINVASKITSMTTPNNISIGEDVFNLLHPKIQSRFEELLITGNE